MSNANCISFGAINLRDEDIYKKRVLEVGSFNHNGGLRSYVESRNPAAYVGTDITPGPGVDVICDAEKLQDKFEKHSFDIVISTEVIEHTKNWPEVVSNMKNVCRPGGIILVTTRSGGFPVHNYPHDYWRYEKDDMAAIFADCKIAVLETEVGGVFLKAIKPVEFSEADLSNYELFNILFNKRVKVQKMLQTDSKIRSVSLVFWKKIGIMRRCLNELIGDWE
jgi:SAM-dependent methyltransferase